jgi:hypothetical protein
VPDVPITEHAEDRLFQKLVGLYDAPAYIRRARHVQEALEDLLAVCRKQREQWLALVRVRLGLLHALASEWSALGPYLANESQCVILEELLRGLRPELRCPIEPTTSGRVLRRALQELCESLERFNRRWREFLSKLDLAPVNEVRAGYNRYYVLEKECAVRSAVVARQGFQPLPPITVADVAGVLPELPVPRLSA